MSFKNSILKSVRHAAIFATVMMTSVAAFAHAHLESATPGINATVSGQPQAITLNFSADVMLMNVKLINAQGQAIPLTYQISNELKKSFQIPVSTLTAGKYTVQWSAMGKDGHNMNSDYSFSIQ